MEHSDPSLPHIPRRPSPFTYHWILSSWAAKSRPAHSIMAIVILPSRRLNISFARPSAGGDRASPEEGRSRDLNIKREPRLSPEWAEK